jgi:hypothetical protein
MSALIGAPDADDDANAILDTGSHFICSSIVTINPGCTGDIASDGSLVAADEPDGFIGVPDFFAVLQAWGPCPKPTDCPANIVDDSQNPEYAVDVDDFFFVLQNWGPCTATDTDGDGISDFWENHYGITAFDDPTDAYVDHDNDGLSTLDEITIHGTHPNDADSDDDGVIDGAEVLGESDPMSASDNGIGPNSENVYYVRFLVQEWIWFDTGYDPQAGPPYYQEPGVPPGPIEWAWQSGLRINGTLLESSGTVFVDYVGYFNVVGPVPVVRCTDYELEFVMPDYDGIEIDRLWGGGLEPEDLYSLHANLVDVQALNDQGVYETIYYGPFPWVLDSFACRLREYPGGAFTSDPAGPCNGSLIYSPGEIPEVNLNIDSDNNNPQGTPDFTIEEEDVENQEGHPGKIIISNINAGDETDGDGIPGFAEGYDCSVGSTLNDLKYLMSEGGKYTNFALRVTSDSNAPGIAIRLDFDESLLSDVLDYVPCGTPVATVETYWREHPRPQGSIRIWKWPSHIEMWSYHHEGGGVIESGRWYDAQSLLYNGQPDSWGNISLLWIEGINPGTTTIKATVAPYDGNPSTLESFDPPGDCEWYSSDTIKITVVDLAVHDLQHWGPQYDAGTGILSLNNTDFHVPPGAVHLSMVDGAIIDRASACLVHMNPSGAEIDPTAQWEIRFHDMLSTHDVDHPVSTGTIWPSHDAGGTVQLPLLPTPHPLPQGASAHLSDYSSGTAFYVPPDQMAGVLAQEVRPIKYSLLMNGTLIETKTFYLRRPPLVLVHGILSSPLSWKSRWTEETPTRVYRTDWSKDDSGNWIHHKGFVENYGYVGPSDRTGLAGIPVRLRHPLRARAARQQRRFT